MCDKKNFIITGADFKNKGAQSMLFITVSELRRRFKDCGILLVTFERGDWRDIVAFDVIKAGADDWTYARGGFDAVKAIWKNTARSVLKKSNFLTNMFLLKKYLMQADAVIDISGYSLSSQWDYKRNAGYINRIRTAKKFGIPVFLMPQSFGPFEYRERREKILGDIKKYLPYPVRIYAREKGGYADLTERIGLTNVVLSSDLVLQNKEIRLDTVLKGNLSLRVPEIIKGENGTAAIIPNVKNFEHGNREKLIELYKKLIKLLIDQGVRVYLLRHAKDDLEAVHIIYENLEQKDNVIMIEDDINCLEYDKIISEFDFIIASRYHSIVHAYKRGVPAIILGWAEKYHELARIFRQKNVVFDVRKEINMRELEKAVMALWQNRSEAEAEIRNSLMDIQKENCFDVVSEYFA